MTTGNDAFAIHLAYPSSPTEVVDPMSVMIENRAYDDYGNACVSGSVQPTLGATQCSTLAGDTSTAFNAMGAPTSVTDASGNQTTNAYENASYPMLVTSTTNPLGAVTKYLYDADGRLLTTTNPDGSAVTTNYNANGEVCTQEPTKYAYPCGQGPVVPGVSQYSYNDAGEMVGMSDNVASPASTRWSQDTTYSYVNGQLTSTTDANAATLSYAYNDAGQVACIAYPVSSSATCSSGASSSNTTVTRSYDSLGRLSAVSDWLGNTTNYAYGDPWTPTTPTSITYPSSTGLIAHYGYDNNGAATSLSASSSVTSGTPISDSWTLNADSQVSVSSINGATSGTQSYNANGQLTQGANLATSTSNDSFSIAPNGSITNDASPSGSATAFTYTPGTSGTNYQLCNVATTPSACGSTSGTGTNYTYTTNGQRSAATPYSAGVSGASTTYAWNPYGELCNVASTATACGSLPTSGTSYQYNGLGLRTSATTSTSTTTSSWDSVTGGSMPLNVNDATTTSSGNSTTSYLYGDLLFGGTAPVEQITTSRSGTSVSFLVSNQTGVQGVYSGNSGSLGAIQEMAIYSLYGTQTLSSGSKVTPFGFQGSYSDGTGLIYLINRYYDPTTDQFMSVDPDVATTNQPYAFVNDSPLNAEDPLGLRLAGVGTESCAGTLARLTCTGANPSGISVAGTITTTSAKETIIVGASKVTVSTSVTVETSGSSRAPTVTIDKTGSASVTLPGYIPITVSSSGAVGAALGNNSGASMSVGTDGLTFTDAIPSATIGGSNVSGSISANASFRDDAPSGGIDWLPIMAGGMLTVVDWYARWCAQTYGLTCAVDG